MILNLAIWFALHVLFRDLQEAQGFGINVDLPVLTSVDIPSLVLTLGAIIAVFRFKVGMLSVLAACSIWGLFYGLLMGWI